MPSLMRLYCGVVLFFILQPASTYENNSQLAIDWPLQRSPQQPGFIVKESFYSKIQASTEGCAVLSDIYLDIIKNTW